MSGKSIRPLAYLVTIALFVTTIAVIVGSLYQFQNDGVFLLEWCLSSSAMVLLFLLVRRLLRRHIDPRLMYALWLVVALRLLIPGQWFTLPISVVGSVEKQVAMEEIMEDITPKATVALPVEANSTPEREEQSWTVFHGGLIYDRTYNPQPTEEGPNGTLEVTYGKSFNFRPFWIGVWYTVFRVFSLAIVILKICLYYRFEKRRRPLPKELPYPCSLPIHVMDNLASPCLFRCFWMEPPTIYLNQKALDSGHIDHVVAHEMTHYRHGDDIWVWLRLSCLALHWYNPLVWWAMSVCRRDCELACDAGTIAALGEDQRLKCGRTLLSMVSPGLHVLPLVTTATTMTAGKRALKDRILRIAHKPRTLAVAALAGILVLALSIAVTGGGQGADTTLNTYWGTYETMELLYQNPLLSFAPSPGETVVLETNQFSAALPLGATSEISNPIYRPTDFDVANYVPADLLDSGFNPFPQFETVQVFTIQDDGEELPLHLLLADGTLLLAENPGDRTGCRVWRLGGVPDPLTEDGLLELYNDAEQAYGWFYGEMGDDSWDPVLRFKSVFPNLYDYNNMERHLSELFAPEIVDALMERGSRPTADSGNRLQVSLFRNTNPNAGYCRIHAVVLEDAQPYGGKITVTTEVLSGSGDHLGEQSFHFYVLWDGENWVFTSFGLWDDVESNLFHQAQAILENLERDVSRLLYLLRGMDWSVLEQVGREQLGMDDPVTDVLTKLTTYVTEAEALTEADYADILTANRGLDGTCAEAYSAILEELYRRDRSLFELVVTGYTGADGCLDLLHTSVDATAE